MGALFLKLLNMSITAGWVILAVICVRLLFRKIPKWIHCGLWSLVAIRLIVPFSMESTFSLQPSAQPIQWNTIAEGEKKYDVPSVDSDLSIVNQTINPMLEETFTNPKVQDTMSLPSFTEMAGCVWFCGMLILVFWAIGSVIRLRFLVRESVSCKEYVYMCDAVKSPFILGLVKPRIYLSSDTKESDMDYMIAHEMAHIRRKDYLWKPLGYLLLCIYWFHPLFWIAYVMLCKDIELACDEKVIQDLNFEGKKEYAKVLLSCATQRHLVMVCPLAFGEVGVKERVKTVLNYKKPAFWITLIAMLAGLIVSVCFLTNPLKKHEIRITIPAGSTAPFYYSDEEISPAKSTMEFLVGQDVGDSEIVLKPIEVKDEIKYQPTYITPGMPVELEVEKGGWYRIGLNIQNTTTEDIDVYVTVYDVEEVRIANSQDGESASEMAELLAGDVAYYLELSEADRVFEDMSENRKSEILAEYGNLLEEYTFVARETADGKSAYLTGYYKGDIEQNPLCKMYTTEYGDGSLQRDFQILYAEENAQNLDAALNEKGISGVTTEGIVVEHSRIFWSANGASVFIQPVDSVHSLTDTFLIYHNPIMGPSYIKDALRRGIALNTPEGPYLRFYNICSYGEIAETIPLTEKEAEAILSEETIQLPEGYGFAASLNVNGETEYFFENRVPQSVVDLAIEKCIYQFTTPESISAPISKASLVCNWLEEPIILEETYLAQLEEILKSAEFTGVGNCGYGATLIVTLENGECMTILKGTDDCGSLVFGSYGGYSISDEADDAFWEMFGLSADAEGRLNQKNE